MTTLSLIVLGLLSAAALAGVPLYVNSRRDKRGAQADYAPQPAAVSTESFTPAGGHNSAVPAKEAFLSHIGSFIPLLAGYDSPMNIPAWTEKIIDIDNPGLTALWEQCHRNPAMWWRVLSSWGLRQDTCRSFTFMNRNTGMYELPDGAQPQTGTRYKVIAGCWILTSDDDNSKRIVKKGIIAQI